MFCVRIQRRKKIVDLFASKLNLDMKKILLPILWLLIVFFGYKLYNSIYEPIQFNKVKEERYTDVIQNLKDISLAQVAHKSVTGIYAQDFKSLIEFVDTAQ
jgi:translation initiation factor 2 alpha subunit (eIF-2alpha)